MSKFSPSSDIPSLAGKVAIVTGGNRGMGFHISQQLANHGAKVYIAARSETSAKEAIKRIETENAATKGHIAYLNLDLSTLKGSQQAAKKFLQFENRLDILVLNGGVMSHPYTQTSDHLEDCFAVNHLAPFVLTKTLLPVLTSTSKQANADVRVVTVTSEIHSQAPSGGKFFTVDEINNPLASPMFRDFLLGRYARYARSKLANILFAKQLQKEFDSTSSAALSISVNPGGVATDTVLQNMGSVFLIGPLMRFMVSRLAKSPLDGAATTLYAATSPEVKANAGKFGGAYLIPYGKPVLGSKDSQDSALAEKLWKSSNDISAAILDE